MSDKTMAIVSGVLLLLLVVALAAGYVERHSPPTVKPEHVKCTRVYDRRDASGSITITWDGACSRV